MTGRLRRLRRRGVAPTVVFGALCVGVLLVAPAAATTVSFAAPGANKALVSALKSASLLMAAKPAEAKAQDLFSAARADYRRMLGALYNAGYFAPVIHVLLDGREAASIAPLDAPATIGAIKVTVVPGPLFHFGKVSMAPLAADTELPKAFGTGEVAKSGSIQAAVDAAVQGWRKAGHAEAKVAKQKVIADARTHRLSVEITLAPGPDVTLGRLIISGDSAVRRKRIEQIAGFPTGTPYTPKKLETSANRLRRTGAFASVALTEADKLGPGNTLDVTAAVVDQKKRQIGLGAEISSSAGANLTAFWLHRNLFGGAERFRLDGEIDGIGSQEGGRSYKLTARLDRPATQGPDTSLYMLGSVQRQNLTDYTANTLTLGVGKTRIVNDRLTLSFGLGYDAEKVTDAAGNTAYRDATLPLEATWDSRDNKLDAHKGIYFDLGLMPFKGFSGTGSGGKLTFDGRIYRAVGKRIVLAARLQGGSILGASLASTPRTYLFYSGGGGTVRGQPYQSLGVYALGNGVRTGGRSFLGVSGEVRTQVSGPIGLVAFYDAGYVGAKSLGGQGAWQAGAGLGFRYETGIGPIRLDVGAPVSGHTGKGVQLYLGIGQAF